MKEKEKEDALKIVDQFELFTKEKERHEKIRKFVENDRTLQSMLINPSFKDYFCEVNFSLLKELKQEVKDKVSFELDEINEDIVLPQEKEKEAVKDLIKTVSGRYNRSLNVLHIIENGSVKRVLK